MLQQTGLRTGNRSGPFINAEWRGVRGGSIPNQEPTLTQFSSLRLPKSVITGINSQRARLCVWIDRAEHMQSIAGGGTGPHPNRRRPSLRCPRYLFSIVVELTLRTVPLRTFSLIRRVVVLRFEGRQYFSFVSHESRKEDSKKRSVCCFVSKVNTVSRLGLFSEHSFLAFSLTPFYLLIGLAKSCLLGVMFLYH